MSPGLDAPWPVASFADLDRRLWGVVIGGPDAGVALGRLDGPPAVGFEPAAIATGESSSDWTVTGAGFELRLSVAGAPAELVLCRVTGEVVDGGGARDAAGEIDAEGAYCAALARGGLDSVRLAAGWFAAGHALALLAARPKGASGHDRDAISVAIAGDDAVLRLSDPRLSTTYDGTGAARRMGVEIWLGADDDEEHRSRRMAGEHAGQSAATTIAGVRLEAVAMRCHSRGDDGLGVYLLARAA